MIISLDIETYGAVERNRFGEPMPPQTVFHPVKALHIDGVRPSDLIVNAAITFPTEQFEVRSVHDLARLEPGETMVFHLWKQSHRRMLQMWLDRATVILGMNLQFDVTWLMYDPQFRIGLKKKPMLVDLSVLNYLHDETRPERSLKAVGPVLNTHVYRDEDTLKFKRFEAPGAELDSYVAQDTHNTMLAARELARRIVGDYHGCRSNTAISSLGEAPSVSPLLPGFGCIGASSKGSERSLLHYSNVAWTGIRMAFSGFAMDRPGLLALERRLLARIERTARIAESLGVRLSGEGSGKAKSAFMAGCVRQAVRRHGPGIMEGFELSEVKKEVGYKDVNRHHLLNLLPRDHMRSRVLRIMELHSKAQKLHSTYVHPLLYHRKNRPNDRSSKLVRHGNAWMAYPTWYIVPSPAKDGMGDSGGTIQGRITCKSPGRQTFPRSVSALCRSRWSRGLVASFDLSQIELRVAAVLSGEPALVGAYREGRDLHFERAVQIFEEVTRDRRAVGKMVNFADLFDSSPSTMQAQVLAMTGISLPLSLFEEIKRNRPIHRPVLTAWQQALKEHTNLHRYIEVPIVGQSRWYISGATNLNKHEIVNQPIQTMAGNVLLEIQHNLAKRIPEPFERGCWVFQTYQVYDSVYLDVQDPSRLPELRGLIGESVLECEEEGIWAELQNLTGVRVPLQYDLEGFPQEHIDEREPAAHS